MPAPVLLGQEGERRSTHVCDTVRHSPRREATSGSALTRRRTGDRDPQRPRRTAWSSLVSTRPSGWLPLAVRLESVTSRRRRRRSDASRDPRLRRCGDHEFEPAPPAQHAGQKRAVSQMGGGLRFGPVADHGTRETELVVTPDVPFGAGIRWSLLCGSVRLLWAPLIGTSGSPLRTPSEHVTGSVPSGSMLAKPNAPWVVLADPEGDAFCVLAPQPGWDAPS
jgi:hypothetical protein